MRKVAVAIASFVVLASTPAFAGGMPSGTSSVKPASTGSSPKPVKKRKHHKAPKAKPVSTPESK